MAQPQLEKVYDPNRVEDKWYQHWLDQNYFHVKPDPQKKPYTVVIPPPNITGMLTMGHVSVSYTHLTLPTNREV